MLGLALVGLVLFVVLGMHLLRALDRWIIREIETGALSVIEKRTNDL
jgi:hypothetical protein